MTASASAAAARCAVVLAAVLFGHAMAAQDWNQWRGPARTGVAAAFDAPAEWPAKPTRVWQARVGLGHSSPIVSGGRVFQHSRLGEDEVVTAFDLPSGKQIWQQRYAAPYQVNPAAEAHGKGPKSTPIVRDGKLFTLGVDAALAAFDAASGKVLWRHRFAKEFDAASPDFGTAMSPMVENGLLIVLVGGNKTGGLAALDAATGSVKWMWRGDSPAYASPIAVTLAGTRQIVTQSRSHVVGLSAADGSPLWTIPFKTSYDQNIVTPLVLDDLVIYSGVGQPLIGSRLTNAGGKWRATEVWRNDDLSLYMSSPVLAAGALFGFTFRSKGQFFAADPSTGKTRWTTRGREAENASLAIAGKWLLAATTEGELVVARPDPARFDVVKRYTVAESPIWAHPVPAGRGVLIKDAETLAYWTF